MAIYINQNVYLGNHIVLLNLLDMLKIEDIKFIFWSIIMSTTLYIICAELFNDSDDLFVRSLVDGVIEYDEELEKIANKYLNNWTINRLGFTDQAIIKIGIYELLHTDTPFRVCIDEAIELAHEYSDDAVVKMINGVLDKVYHNECC